MVVKWDVAIPELTGEETRRGYVYLPESYESEPDRRYPVLYMFDGHNVFFDEDATFGKSWGMKTYMDQSKKQLIIVGIECNHNGNDRIMEYSPFDFEYAPFGTVPGKGGIYMDWLVKTLKPYIDATYRTLPDRANTIIAGSSMGGLMTLYGVSAYNDVFQRGAALSPSMWIAPDKSLEMLNSGKMDTDTCLYMDYGSVEMANHNGNPEVLGDACRALLKKGVNLTFRIVPGGTHSEASWEKQIPIFMECLGL